MRRVLSGLVLAALIATAPILTTVEAQGAVVAFCYLDTSYIGGALQPLPAGWQWAMVCAYSNPNTNAKDIVTGVLANTANGDSLATVGTKLAAAAKTDAAQRGFTIAAVVLPQSVIVNTP